MSESKQLGGQRKSSPLDDEESYPLTRNEYLVLKDNLINNKFSTLESSLLSILITSLISGIIFITTTNFFETEIINEVEIEKLNYENVIITITYFGVFLGCTIGFFISYNNKSKAKNAVDRLDERIIKHLNRNNP